MSQDNSEIPIKCLPRWTKREEPPSSALRHTQPLLMLPLVSFTPRVTVRMNCPSMLRIPKVNGTL